MQSKQVIGVLGGKFESALIHSMDALNNPDRNKTNHPYYLGLNRNAGKAYFDRMATFVTMLSSTFVPLADWGAGDDSTPAPTTKLGVTFNASGGEARYGEWDEATVTAAKGFISSNFLTDNLYEHISFFNRELITTSSGVDPEKEAEIARSVALHYVCRLILQVREADDGRALILDDQDLILLDAISAYWATLSTPAFPFPEISANTIFGQSFCGGLLNFSPDDVKSIIAIREDKTVSSYAEEVRQHIANVSTEEGEQKLLRAMSKAYRKRNLLKRLLTLFEVRGWLAKPVMYIPAVGNAAAVANDAADVTQKVIDKSVRRNEWFLLAARAHQINIEEYLHRKANML